MEVDNEVKVDNDNEVKVDNDNEVKVDNEINIGKMEDSATLEFFTNPMYLSTLKRKNIYKEELDVCEKIKFYKKRIISLFKDILKGDEKPPTNELNEMHDIYVRTIIKYFEQVDKKDIIQSQHLIENNKYNEINENNKSPEDILNEMVCENLETIDEANDIMMRKKIEIPNLNNYVISVNDKDVSGNNVRIIPHIIDINLNTPDLKTKGVKPKKAKINPKIIQGNKI